MKYELSRTRISCSAADRVCLLLHSDMQRTSDCVFRRRYLCDITQKISGFSKGWAKPDNNKQSQLFAFSPHDKQVGRTFLESVLIPVTWECCECWLDDIRLVCIKIPQRCKCQNLSHRAMNCYLTCYACSWKYIYPLSKDLETLGVLSVNG